MKITNVREGILLLLLIGLVYVVGSRWMKSMNADMGGDASSMPIPEETQAERTSDTTVDANREPSLRERMLDEWSAIDLYYDYDTGSKSIDGGYYQLRCFGSYCTFYYSGPGMGEEISCNFTMEIYEEMLDLVLSSNPKPYAIRSDENGKITYEVLPSALRLYWGGGKGQQMLCETPENMDEIIARFEELKEAAKE